MSRSKWVDRTLAAAGQFVIIVAGVLGALWAQEWQDSRSARVSEIEHLDALHDGITEAKHDLIQEDSIAHGRVALLASFLAKPDTLLTVPEHVADSLLYEGLFRMAGASVALPAYEDLKSSGQLGSIGSPPLRRQLQVVETWMGRLEDALFARDRAQEQHLDPILAERTDFAQLMNAWGGGDIPSPGPRQRHGRLLEASDVQGYIAFKIGLTRVVTSANRELRLAYDRSLELIEQRLDELGAELDLEARGEDVHGG